MVNDQYFPLEANLPDDDRLCQLIEQMGIEGMGIYITLLMELRRRNGYRLSMQSLPRIARNMHVSLNKVLTVIVDFGLFHLEGSFEKGILSSEYMDRVMMPLDRKRDQKIAASLKGYQSVDRTSGGQFTAAGGAVKKSKGNKSKEKESTSSSTEEETAAAAAKSVSLLPWETYFNQAMNEQSWLEVAGIQSGLGMDYLNHLPYIIALFKEHICVQGTEGSIQSLRDAKSYFANFIRNGTPTNTRLRQLLEKEKQRCAQQNPYRYEDIDPLTGARSYCGISIPRDAPPRPGENSLWDAVAGEWSG